MSVITIRNLQGHVWHLYPAVMVSRKETHCVLRAEMRTVFQEIGEKKYHKGYMKAYGRGVFANYNTIHDFTFHQTPNTYRMGCQRFDRSNMRILRKWALR